MSNMSYCRFRNTVADLRDCMEHLEDNTNDLAEGEAKARLRLINVCVDIALDYGREVDREVEDAS